MVTALFVIGKELKPLLMVSIELKKFHCTDTDA